MKKEEDLLKEKVKKLFDDNAIDFLIGYEKGTLPLTNRPCFIHNKEMVDKLVWNPLCINNLAIYLPHIFQKVSTKKPRIGVVAKGCVIRSIINLAIENQIPRENLVIINMPCNGVYDLKKIQEKIDPDDIAEYNLVDDGLIKVRLSIGAELELKKNEFLSEACANCLYPDDKLSDIKIIKIEGNRKVIDDESRHVRINEFLNKSTEERWDYFKKEISRCIRCNACRQACPNCYCSVCFADSTKPKWIGKSDNLSDIMIYHIGRMFHQAGRCVECGACTSACPMGIDLELFMSKLAKDAQDLYDFMPGLSLENEAPLSGFSADDKQDFITEPQENIK